MRRQPLRSTSSANSATTVNKKRAAPTTKAADPKPEQQQPAEEPKGPTDRESWSALAIADSSCLKLGAVVHHRSQLWRVRFIGPVIRDSFPSSSSSSKSFVGLELLQPRDEPQIDASQFRVGPKLDTSAYFSCPAAFSMLVPLGTLFPPLLLQSAADSTVSSSSSKETVACQTDDAADDEKRERRQLVDRLQTQVRDLEQRLSDKASSSTSSASASAAAAASASLQQLLDLLQRQAVHDGVLLDEAVAGAFKAPNVSAALEEGEDGEETMASTTVTTKHPMRERLAAWLQDVEQLQDGFLSAVDECQSRIASRADTAIEISQRLLFDADDLVRSKEEAAMSGDVDVREVQKALMQAAMAAVSACKALTDALDDDESHNIGDDATGGGESVVQIEQRFSHGALEKARASLLELRQRHEAIKEEASAGHSELHSKQRCVHGASEKLTSDFAVTSYRVDKAKVTEEKQLYDTAVEHEQRAAAAVTAALASLGEASRARAEARESLQRACQQAQRRRLDFGERLSGLRDEERGLRHMVADAASAVQQVDTAVVRHRDTATAVDHAAGDILALSQANRQRLLRQHSEAHRAMTLHAGLLIYRHRAGAAAATGAVTEVEKQIEAIACAVEEEDAKFRATSLGALQFREQNRRAASEQKDEDGDDDLSQQQQQKWVDPRETLQQLLEERNVKLARGSRVMAIQDRDRKK